MWYLRLIWISFIFFLASCASDQLALGIVSFKVQDYRQAFLRLKPQAAKGQADAQYAVGYMYYYGQGVVENRKKACFWIKAAAAQRQPDAIAALEILKDLASCYKTTK